MKKSFKKPKISPELERAQYRVDRAVVRGEDKETIAKLRKERDNLAMRPTHTTHAQSPVDTTAEGV